MIPILNDRSSHPAAKPVLPHPPRAYACAMTGSGDDPMSSATEGTLRVLLVEDDARLARLTSQYLEIRGLHVTVASHGPAGLAALNRGSFDVVLLDLLLPGQSGLEVCREIRRRSDVPIIMVTALDDEVDRVVGFEAGADDYLCKPFSSPELLARIRAHVRRARGQLGPSDRAIESGRLTIHPATFQATLDGRDLELTTYEFTILRVLAERSGRPVSRDQLLDLGDGPVYFGLYTGTEVPHFPMLDDQFGSDDGNLYKASGDGATWAVFDPESFDKKTHKSDDDFGDLERMYEALHASRADPELWRTDLESAFDVDGFLRWLATNTVIQNWDSYGNTPQNYYLYSDPLDDGRVAWIAWDFNESLKSEGVLMPVLSLELDEVGDDWPLIRFLMDDTVYRQSYVAHVGEVLDGAFDGEATAQRFSDAHALIYPYVIGEGGENAEYSFTDADMFEGALESLITDSELRTLEVQQFLDEQ